MLKSKILVYIARYNIGKILIYQKILHQTQITRFENSEKSFPLWQKAHKSHLSQHSPGTALPPQLQSGRRHADLSHSVAFWCAGG